MDMCSPRYMVINRLWPIPIWAKQQHQQPQVAKAEHMPSVWSFLVLLAFLHLLFLLRINTSPGSSDVFWQNVTRNYILEIIWDMKRHCMQSCWFNKRMQMLEIVQVRNCKKHCEYNLMLNHCITSVLICMFHASSTRWFEGTSCMPLGSPAPVWILCIFASWMLKRPCYVWLRSFGKRFRKRIFNLYMCSKTWAV